MSSSRFLPPRLERRPALGRPGGLRPRLLTLLERRPAPGTRMRGALRALPPVAELPRPPRGHTPARARGPARRHGLRAAATRPAILALSVRLEPGIAEVLADALAARALRVAPPPATVIVDLAPAGEIDPACCAALRTARDRLRAGGVCLLVSVGARRACERPAAESLAETLGRGAVHQSLRSAVLSVYAALPGPGVVTTDVRDALAAPAEPLHCPPGGGSQASPAEDGAAIAGSWWTEVRQAAPAPPGAHRMGG